LQLTGARLKEAIAVECLFRNTYRNPLSARRAGRPQLNSGVSAQTENWMTSRRRAPASTPTSSLYSRRSCAGPFAPWKASVAPPAAPRPRRLDRIIGSLAARSISIESLGRRRSAPPDRSAVCVVTALARCVARCRPPRGCAL